MGGGKRQREGQVRGPEKADLGLLEELKEDRGSVSKREAWKGQKGEKEPDQQGLLGGLCPGQLWLTPVVLGGY